MSGNYFHGNVAGCLAANVNVDHATIVVESSADRFENYGNGCILISGNATGTGTARNNLLVFSANASSFAHNTGALPAVFPTRAGIGAYGGVSTVSDRAFDNVLKLELHSATFSDNGGPDVAAWGAISSAPLPAGTGNSVTLFLRGSSQQSTVAIAPSAPAEPAGTNRVIVSP